VKQEDVDWQVYHLIPPEAATTAEELAGKSGLGLPVIEASLARLERSCLIECAGGTVRMLNFGEALLRNQCKYEQDLPFTIENGVVRAKRK
jgi:hypothetical protein